MSEVVCVVAVYLDHIEIGLCCRLLWFGLQIFYTNSGSLFILHMHLIVLLEYYAVFFPPNYLLAIFWLDYHSITNLPTIVQPDRYVKIAELGGAIHLTFLLQEFGWAAILGYNYGCKNTARLTFIVMLVWVASPLPHPIFLHSVDCVLYIIHVLPNFPLETPNLFSTYVPPAWFGYNERKNHSRLHWFVFSLTIFSHYHCPNQVLWCLHLMIHRFLMCAAGAGNIPLPIHQHVLN